MARIDEGELERLKAEVSLERLVASSGVALVAKGRDRVGRCPFHDDDTPSLVVSPSTNLWHCLGACQAGGSVIDWVMRRDGVSFRHAVELLRAGALSSAAELPSVAAPSGAAVMAGGRPKATKLSAALEAADGDDAAALARVMDFYHRTLKLSAEGLGYLERRGLGSAELVEHFQLGLSNRTLGYKLPPKSRKRGKALREQLTRLGVLRPSGHEHLCGSLVVPLVDAEGRVVQMYGRKVGDGLRKDTALHLYLPGPQRGVFNPEAFEGEELIVCESVIDAMTFWVAGYRHVTSCYGAGGLPVDVEAALSASPVKRVLLAFDRDKAGERGAERVAAALAGRGLEVLRVLFPQGLDANAYAVEAEALSPGSSRERLGALLRSAAWLGGGRRPRVAVAAPSVPATTAPARAAMAEAAQDTKKQEAAEEEEGAAGGETPSSPSAAGVEGGAPVSAQAPPPLEANSELRFVFDDRRWRIRLMRAPSRTELRLHALVRREDASLSAGHGPNPGPSVGAGFFVDTLELYAARQRAAFTKMAAAELGLDERVLHKDLGSILLELERRQEEAEAQGAAPARPELSDEERAEALALLRDPKLLDRVLNDFERVGVVGERTNKLIGYLAATSRKLDEPLAVVIQSSSAAGKSSLMEAVLSLLPEEDRVQYSAMTGQSLFYMGDQDLKHKVLAIVEEEGAERASYALKLLQSEGELTIASTGKDPQSGRLVTHQYRVEGPVMIMLTTTAIDIDEELLNRCLVLTVDEGRAQTRAIHARQRRAQTLEGLLEREERRHLLRLHRNAQRLLEPLLVVNAHAERLSFTDRRTRTRRDHMKYLTLIKTIAFLHQHQRAVKTVQHRGASLRYIEVEESDIALADRLCTEVLLRSLDELPPQTRTLLEAIAEMTAEMGARLGCPPGAVRFTRRDVKARTGWSMTQLRLHLGRLEEHELVSVVAGGGRRRIHYELGAAELAGAAGVCLYDEPLAGGGGVLGGGGGARGGGAERQGSASPSGVGEAVRGGGAPRGTGRNGARRSVRALEVVKAAVATAIAEGPA